MKAHDDPHAGVFLEEAQELLGELESSLLELENRPDDEELVGGIFRAMHTIKGSGAMFGFDDIAAFTHEVETAYDKVRKGELPVTTELINLTLQAKDRIRFMLTGPDSSELPSGATADEIVASFRQLTADAGGTPPGTQACSKGPQGPENDLSIISPGHDTTYRIGFEPSRDIFLLGTNPLLLFDELRSLGECEVVARLDDVPVLLSINPEECYVSWDIILTTNRDINAIQDVFIFVEDHCRLMIEAVKADTVNDPEASGRRLGEILVERGDVREEELTEALSEQKRLGEILVDKGITTHEKVKSALVEQQHERRVKEKSQAKDEGISSIRVSADKLDALVNLVGELVTAQARLTQTASRLRDAELATVAEEVERLTAELRDNTLNTRMLPIGSTFGRFKRLIRDLSQELGKEIEMTTEGAETELDKTVIERLNDPLVHLIRNCIDHGIEPPDMREALGKPRTGSIRLSAVHSGAHVIIQIKDDGKGLDKGAIHSKALEMGLLHPNVEYTDREIFGCIFHPGFSTATEVTSVSGRGVGMDVVRRVIDALRGSIQTESEKGRGTTVTVKLPLTLAIVEGLLVEIGESSFILPLSIVEECVELSRDDAARLHGRSMANIRGEIVPYIRLRQEFEIEGEPPPIEQIVVAGVNGSRIGFVVDKVIGGHQTVIKSLGKFYEDVEVVSGATILGDGTLALIVDAARLAAGVELREARLN
jgi:two-component system, chemotaxis family, sensor kinase CheA